MRDVSDTNNWPMTWQESVSSLPPSAKGSVTELLEAGKHGSIATETC